MKSFKNRSYVLTVNISTVIKAGFICILTFIIMFSLSGIISSLKPGYQVNSTIIHKATKNISSKLLFQFLAADTQMINASISSREKPPSIFTILLNSATNISFKDPRSFLGRELPGFTFFDSEILVAGEGTNFTNLPIESVPSDKVFKSKKDPKLKNNVHLDEKDNKKDKKVLSKSDKPSVFIYFTHTRESFLPYLDGVDDPNAAQHSKVNVTNLGIKLKEQLEDRGIGTLVDSTDVQSELLAKGWKYPQSYQESRELVQTAMARNRNLQYFIDIHRDSRRKKDTTISINGKSYAKIAFVIGGNNPNYEKNAHLAKQLDNRLKKNYKGLSRGVIKKEGALTNGKFNQDLSGNAFLIEVGGVDNTFDEMYRTTAALADVFSEYYWQAEKVNGNQSDPPAAK
ncbi:stage II sporulation protein P [Heyndrickxia sporothermodurans]|uniref:stage II sporulation protein P n=1 Tax=Heyndrickxia sporothermodurans TaxID=46224 RepID=UPI002E1C59A6|nr:stage II sporulation protein P [Heyndrickxia sporothermodurans]MED3654511.1 stage II sporulation protein P [Heyndrickxia sporothermodurans]MED3696684.1 stage II sporulation protein P [Heyndrickxia sporothermodurans]